MKRRTKTTTRQSRRKTGGLSWMFYVVSTMSVLLLLGSLFLAARNHFTSVKFGFKNAQIKKDIQNLEAEKRRLMVSKEVALSPAEVSKSARKMGFVAMTARNIEGVKTGTDMAKGAQSSQKQQPTMLASLSVSDPARKVSRTAQVSPVADTQRARN